MAASGNLFRRLSCGQDFSFVADVKSTLDSALANGFDFICLPISHPRLKREFLSGRCKDRVAQFARSDLTLSSEEWSYQVVAKCSEYIDCDSVNEDLRMQSEQTLIQELRYASYLAVMMAHITLTRPNNVNLAYVIHKEFQKESMNCGLWVQVPMVPPSVQACRYRSNCSSQAAEPDTWEWWNQFRILCHHNERINLVLELTSDLPPKEEVARWLGEPIDCILISASLFTYNQNGFPELPKDHLAVLEEFLALKIRVVISGTLKVASIENHVEYMSKFYQNLHTVDHGFWHKYENILINPLQPLRDNLDSKTYEQFEKDPVKYKEYQRAISLALLDRVPLEQKDSVTQVVMVVGAGRGPLVNATLTAAHQADRKVRVYALDKNPNAFVTLQAFKNELWRDLVTIVSCDMRDWDAPELADILVSELLGSFGDNELSPECLDGAQKFLKDDGISIPSSYTSYLTPSHNPRLYSQVFARYDEPVPVSKSFHFEVPYVTSRRQRFPLALTQPLFTFHHPNRDAIIDNSRYKILKFAIKSNSLLHGFTGYFRAVLYKDVMLSIEPSTYSQGMISWSPLFFPIKEPVSLKKGDEVVVHFWRLKNKHKVWYEWTISCPKVIPIHNVNGRGYSIKL